MLLLLCGATFAEDIIWQEDWTGYAKDDVPSAVNSNYSETNGGSTTKIYEETLAGGTSPELLVGRKGGSFAATIALNGKSGEMMLAFKSNKALTITTEGATLGDVDNKGNDYLYPLTVATGTEEITITFTQAQSSNARLDDIKLYQGTAKKPAGLSWGKASTTLTIGQEVTLVLSNENQLPVTYTSSDETVATIDAQGVITLVAAGKTTLTATFEGNDEYEAQSVSIEVTVKDDDQPGPDTPIDEVKTVTISEFIAAEVSTNVWYQLTGLVKNLKDDDIYGNFDLEDETGSVYVYGLISEKGGAKKLFQELVAQKGIKEGSKLTLIGNRGQYNDKIEVLNAYFVSIEGEEPPVEDPTTETVTFNFDVDYAMLFPTLPGVSSQGDKDTGEEASSDGDFTEATTSTAVNGVTVTVTPAENAKTPSRIWASSPRLRMYGGTTFTVTGNNIMKIVFNGNDKFDMNTSVGTLDGKTWTGDMTNEVIFTVGSNTQIKNIVVTLAKGGSEVLGDMNHDGKVDIADVISVLNLIANEAYDKTADLNNDEVVNLADAMLLLEQVAETK